MKLWIDDMRQPPSEGWIWCRSVNDAIDFIEEIEYRFYNYKRIINSPYHQYWEIKLIDIDHDAGEYAKYGGDYIELLNWLEETGRNYPIHIHSMNVVGCMNMRRIIQRNGWKEIR